MIPAHPTASTLRIERCDAAELIDEFGSPLYVISEGELRARIRAWREALDEVWSYGPTRLLPSVKANFALAVQQIVQSEGCGVDTFGAGEYDIARRVGFDPSMVSVNGQKSSDLIGQAVADGARLTIDNLSELPEIRAAADRLGVLARVRLRVRPPLVNWNEPSDLSVDEVPTSRLMGIYKPGVPMDQLRSLTPEMFGDSVELTGLHAHIARNTRDPAYWTLAANEVVACAAAIRERLPGWTPSEIDMGGGFPSSSDTVGQDIQRVRAKYESVPVPPPREYILKITQGLTEGAERHGFSLSGVTLEIEPGRSVFGSSGFHLARVVRLKRQSEPFEHHWVELDTSTSCFGVEEHNRWTTVVAVGSGGPSNVCVDIVGCSCNLDLIVSGARIPQVSPGDVIAFLDAGAYQEASANNFNALPRPAVVLVDGDNAELIRRRENMEDILVRDVVPARLARHA